MKKATPFWLLGLVMSGQAFADQPPLEPTLKMTCSSSGRFCAISDPAKRITRIATGFSQPTLWSLPGWHPFLFILNDGESVVVAYDGDGLVPVNVALTEPVLRFWHHGKLIRMVRLDDLYQDKSQLMRTASHFAWERGIELNQANQLVVELVTGKKVAFAGTTGLREEPVPHGT